VIGFRRNSFSEKIPSQHLSSSTTPIDPTEDIATIPPSLTSAEISLLKLSQAHFTSQALHSIVLLGVPDVLCDSILSAESIATKLQVKVSSDALFRIMRLLTTCDILFETIVDDKIHFGLTQTGALLRTSDSSLAPFVRHWMDDPLWDSWMGLTRYMLSGNTTHYPFDLANGINAPEYFQNNIESTKHRNQVAHFVSQREIPAVMQSIDWSPLENTTIVDIGGGYGELMAAVAARCPTMTCICLDLPSVVEGVQPPPGVTLVAGDMFVPDTIPPCDIIISKHVLCDWKDQDVLRMLESCRTALSEKGILIIVDAVLLDGPEASNQWQVQTSLDVLLMLTGRNMDRSVSQWRSLATSAGFTLDKIISCPSSPSLNITLLSMAS